MIQFRIFTAQNVALDYTPASTMSRILAYLLDLLFFTLIYFVTMLFMGNFIEKGFVNGSGFVTFWLIFFPLFGFLLYHFLGEWLGRGQTWGKKILRIRVVRIDGREPAPIDSLLRVIFQLLETIPTSGILAAVMISTTERNQRIGDITANTTVVKVNKKERYELDDLLEISTLENYTPRYPQVLQLREEDMLLVKSTLNRLGAYPTDGHKLATVELANHLTQLLQIEPHADSAPELLKTLLSDYIVLTR